MVNAANSGNKASSKASLEFALLTTYQSLVILKETSINFIN